MLGLCILGQRYNKQVQGIREPNLMECNGSVSMCLKNVQADWSKAEQIVKTSKRYADDEPSDASQVQPPSP